MSQCYKCDKEAEHYIQLDGTSNPIVTNVLPCCEEHCFEYNRQFGGPVSIVKSFKFESAHNLLKYQGPCQRLHGHSYLLTVKINRKINNQSDMVMDFGDLKKIVNERIVNVMDHAYLNDIFDFNPTAENMCYWIWDQLSDPPVYGLRSIQLWETTTSYAELTAEDVMRAEQMGF